MGIVCMAMLANPYGMVGSGGDRSFANVRSGQLVEPDEISV
jgi:hypothetical protein